MTDTEEGPVSLHVYAVILGNSRDPPVWVAMECKQNSDSFSTIMIQFRMCMSNFQIIGLSVTYDYNLIEEVNQL